VKVGDSVGAPVGGRQAVGLRLLGPAGAGGGADSQGAELVERESAVRSFIDRVLNPGELRVEGRIWGLLPGLGALEGVPAAGE
jgi:hypothetical protein